MKLDALNDNLFLKDILAEPEALRQALRGLDFNDLKPLAEALGGGEIDRVVLTGMGASYFALYTGWLHLAAAGYPAIWVDCAELVHHTPALVGTKTLLVIASQSGRSAEVVALLNLLDDKAAAGAPVAGLVAITNDLESPLAKAAQKMTQADDPSACPLGGALLSLNTEPEMAVSTRTYLNTLAVVQLAALALCSPVHGASDLEGHFTDLEQTINGIETYLAGWEERLEQIADLVGAPSGQPLILVGRGLSFASAGEGALNIEESAKLPAIGMNAAEFRHGPLEIAGPGLTALVFAGGEPVRKLNRKLWDDLREKGVNALWVEPAAGDQLANSALPMPDAYGIGQPLAEIVPVQLLCIHLCLELGLTPGQFRFIEKVTTDL